MKIIDGIQDLEASYHAYTHFKTALAALPPAASRKAVDFCTAFGIDATSPLYADCAAFDAANTGKLVTADEIALILKITPGSPLAELVGLFDTIEEQIAAG